MRLKQGTTHWGVVTQYMCCNTMYCVTSPQCVPSLMMYLDNGRDDYILFKSSVRKYRIADQFMKWLFYEVRDDEIKVRFTLGTCNTIHVL